MTKRVSRTFAVTFGSRVRERRLSLGITQTEVARRMGIQGNAGRVYMSRVEHGKHMPSLSRFVDLCNALGALPNYFFVAWTTQGRTFIA